VIVEAAASAASGSVPYAWFLYLIYALMGVGALFILVVALLLSGLGPVGRRFLFNRGDLVIALFEDGTYDVYKAQRGAFWLWLKSRRVNGAVWLKKGTGFTRSKAPTSLRFGDQERCDRLTARHTLRGEAAARSRRRGGWEDA